MIISSCLFIVDNTFQPDVVLSGQSCCLMEDFGTVNLDPRLKRKSQRHMEGRQQCSPGQEQGDQVSGKSII